MALVLGNHHDFKHEKTALEHVIKNKGHYCVYIPKFHCKLNPIKSVWGKAKQYTRSHCDYSFAGFEKAIHPALNSVSIETIRKYYRKSREYMKAYREGQIDWATKCFLEYLQFDFFMIFLSYLLEICYSYIPLRVGYHCYYTSPRRSRGRVLITVICYKCSGI